jgi:hypothetical protein
MDGKLVKRTVIICSGGVCGRLPVRKIETSCFWKRRQLVYHIRATFKHVDGLNRILWRESSFKNRIPFVWNRTPSNGINAFRDSEFTELEASQEP